MLASSYVRWPNIDSDIDKFIKKCTEFQYYQNEKKVSEKVYTPLKNPLESWKRVGTYRFFRNKSSQVINYFRQF